MEPTQTPPEPVLPPAEPAVVPEPAPVAPVPAAAPAEPVVVSASPVVSAPKPAASDKSVEGKRILLVEDDDSLASVYVTRLQSEGFDVRRVANGEEALSTALSYKPDLVVLDVMMPRVSGFDVLDILRNTPDTADLKIIMLTALSQDTDKERATTLGADEYLVKSQVVIADVVDRIKAHLG